MYIYSLEGFCATYHSREPPDRPKGASGCAQASLPGHFVLYTAEIVHSCKQPNGHMSLEENVSRRSGSLRSALANLPNSNSCCFRSWVLKSTWPARCNTMRFEIRE